MPKKKQPTVPVITGNTTDSIIATLSKFLVNSTYACSGTVKIC